MGEKLSEMQFLNLKYGFSALKVAIEDCCGPLLEKLLFFKMICFLNIFSGYRIKSLNGIQTFFFKYYYYHIYVEI